jgi:LPS O-antigen subunit length determinant protein (WzzB/FepE family)
MDEIDLWAYLEVLWKRKVFILSITFLFAISAAVISFLLPKSYRSELILKIGSVGNMGTESVVSTVIDDVNNVAAHIKSKPFLATVIQKNGFKPKHLNVKAFVEKTPS